MQTPIKRKVIAFWNWLLDKSKPKPIPAEEPQKQDANRPMYRYNCKILTGAGIVKVATDAFNKEDAKERVLLDYIKRLNIKVELVHAYKPKPDNESGKEQQSGTTATV